ncbi:MAG: class I SAM-dependent methyltransferase [Candidatus Omnitrophota bacterium]|nr:class I SAM-dependent methyltransferase [Candidatus Omnitrophota bacterium]
MATSSRKKDKREYFLSLIPSDVKKVLDVGCADGGLCAGLTQKDVEVIGLEKDVDSCAKAREKLDKVFLADIEKFDLPYPKEYFDCIIYADVLEHLFDPLALLKKHIDYLRDGGYIVASIPNIRYYKAIIRLVIGGTWDYSDGGLLDKSHMRFFTLLNIKELFSRAGYEIVGIERNLVAARGFSLLNFLLFGMLKDFLTYQYYIKARKLKGGPTTTAGRKKYKF